MTEGHRFFARRRTYRPSWRRTDRETPAQSVQGAAPSSSATPAARKSPATTPRTSVTRVLQKRFCNTKLPNCFCEPLFAAGPTQASAAAPCTDLNSTAVALCLRTRLASRRHGFVAIDHSATWLRVRRWVFRAIPSGRLADICSHAQWLTSRWGRTAPILGARPHACMSVAFAATVRLCEAKASQLAGQ